MFYTDDPISDFHRYDAEREAERKGKYGYLHQRN